VRHGFKAQSERLSVQAREVLGLRVLAPIDPWLYAKQIGVVVLDFDVLEMPADSKHRLLRADSESWSGMTLKEASVTAIVINPSHSRGRQTNTLMHEIAHLVLKHVPARVDVSMTGMLLLSEYSEDAEAEADWLAAAILLPREALVACRRRGETIEHISAVFGTSEQLCEWRLRMTGVDVQLRRAAVGR
jgi:Zn-dependent peptidase ImmA (M78 family)